MKVSHMNSKLAVVTGAAQGIGRQTAQELADAGYQLVLHDLREPVETLDELRTHAHECLAVTGDVTSQTDVTAQITPPGATITYVVSVDGATIANLTITVNLNTLEARGTYAAAPTP